MLDKLKEILEAMDSNLYYGQVAKAPEKWNYTTFNRSTISKAGKSKIQNEPVLYQHVRKCLSGMGARSEYRRQGDWTG